MQISIFIGDIADALAEALCTSTNPRLSLVMGTGAAIRDRGGFSIARECEEIVGGTPLPVGSAHVTSSGDLPAKAIIHCVASDIHHRSSAAIVRACVVNALRRADEQNCRTVAMPVFATGHAHVSFLKSLEAMRDALETASTNVQEVVVVVQDPEREEQTRHVLCTRPNA